MSKSRLIWRRISAFLFVFVMLVMLSASPVFADMNGIDISGWQPNINTSSVDADFVIVKATEGVRYKNPYRESQLQGAVSSGKKIGVYHFATGVNATAEADFFCETVKDYVGKAVLVLDYEGNALRRGQSYVKEFCDRVLSDTGVKPIVYTTAYVVRSQGFGYVKNEGYGLWVAGYPSSAATGYDPTRKMPYNLGVYDRAIMWQYTSNGHISGYNGRLDLNVYYGDASDWDKLAASGKVAAGSTTKEGTEIPTVESSVTPSGSVLSLTYEVISRQINGEARKKHLGTRYDEVQNFINMVYNDPLDTIVTNTLADVYGSGTVRKTVLGSRYNAVQAEINKRVNSWKKPQIKVDGVLGTETIKAWQKRLGVTADGKIGPNTIKAIQRWSGSTSDGIMGPNTRKAVQRKLGVSADGVWGPQTIRALQRWLNS